MKWCLLLTVLLLGLLAASAAIAAPYGPLSAGTAAGSVSAGKMSAAAFLGAHYPFGASAPRGYPSLPGSHPVNNTFAYDERPDPAAVRGRVCPASAEIVTVCSKRRGEPQKTTPCQ